MTASPDQVADQIVAGDSIGEYQSYQLSSAKDTANVYPLDPFNRRHIVQGSIMICMTCNVLILGNRDMISGINICTTHGTRSDSYLRQSSWASQQTYVAAK